MPDQHIDVGRDIVNVTTGKPILTRERAQQERDDWTAKHPPIPGLEWHISFNYQGEVATRHLQVIPGWEGAFAPPLAAAPDSARRRDDPLPPGEVDRLGALAYQGWFAALPDVVRDSSTATWADVPEPFCEPLRQAAVLVWQHGENAGFHQALLRTLPSGQLGAAGELENLADFIAGLVRLHPGQFDVPEILAEIRSRVTQLRKQAEADARRERNAEGRQ